LDYSMDKLADVSRKAVDGLLTLRAEFETAESPMVISGCIGPRGDGYDPGTIMTPDEAQAYHAWQVGIFAASEADVLTALTITNSNEAIGLTRAAQAAGIPVVMSFTVETDGNLPTGHPLKDAIAEVDEATGNGPVYYLVNCAHPTHFERVLKGEPWAERVRGLRANASMMSHAELEDGDSVRLGAEYAAVRKVNPWNNVLGGCCGTDHHHVGEIVKVALGE